MLQQGSGRAAGQSFPEFLILQLLRDELDTGIEYHPVFGEKKWQAFGKKKWQDRQSICRIAQAKSHRLWRRTLAVTVAAGIPFA